MVAVLQLLRRQWIAALVGLLVTGGACLLATTHVHPSYRATSQMILLLPPESPDPDQPPVNPYLNLPEGMGTTANLIAGMVSTEDVQRDLARQGLAADYTVTFVPAAGPTLDLVVTGGAPESALATRDALMALVDEYLAALQAEADTPPNQLMTASRPTVSQEAEVVRTAVYKAVAAAAGAGLVALLLLCLALDRLAVLRLVRERRSRRSAVAEAVASAKAASKARLEAANGPDPAPAPTEDTATSVEEQLEEAEPVAEPSAAVEESVPADISAVRPSLRRRTRGARCPISTAAASDDGPEDGSDSGPQTLAG